MSDRDTTSNVFTVVELTRRVKTLLETDAILQSLYVRGEVSNYVLSSAGHAYFTLKDSKSQLKCVLFRGSIRSWSYLPRNGEAVIVHGRVTVYEPNGVYQVIADSVQPEGVGLLRLQYEQLRARLESEGLFDESRKRRLPTIPRRIGVVTSPTGAVIRDIINVTRRRFPLTELVVLPTLVQGDDAPDQICKAIQTANGRQDLDLIIVARGGGSLEDLWPFNDERVARAIFASRLPVISAVGHETDVTISDLVADFRAPTPSAAAEQAVPDQRVLRSEISSLVGRLGELADDAILDGRRYVKAAVDVLERHSPERSIEQWRQALDLADGGLTRLAIRRIGLERERLIARQMQLTALSPLRVLSRGFSLVTRIDTGDIVRSVTSVKPGDRVSVRVADGAFGGRVEG